MEFSKKKLTSESDFDINVSYFNNESKSIEQGLKGLPGQIQGMTINDQGGHRISIEQYIQNLRDAIKGSRENLYIRELERLVGIYNQMVLTGNISAKRQISRRINDIKEKYSPIPDRVKADFDRLLDAADRAMLSSPVQDKGKKWVKKILLVYLTESPSRDYPIGVYTLKKYIQLRYGDSVQIEIKDIQLEKMDEIAEFAKSWNPDILGLSIMPEAGRLLDNFIKMYEDKIKGVPQENQPLLVLGKNYPTFMYDELIKKYPKAICVLGEGELSLSGLLEYLRGNENLEKIPNLVYLDGKKVIKTKRAVVPVPDTPIDYENLERYLEMGGNAWMESERGCSWGHCTFCSTKSFWGFANNHRPKPIPVIIEELKTLNRKGVQRIIFTDEEFFGHGIEGLERVQELAKAIIADNIKISFYTNAMANSIYDSSDKPEVLALKRKTLEMIHQAGLQTMYLGIESGSQTQLKRFAKGMKVEDAKQAIKIAREVGIELAIGWLTIEPLVTLQELRDSINFIRETGILPYLSTPLNELRVFDLLPYAQFLKNEQKKLGRPLISETVDPVSMTRDIVGFKYPEVGRMMKWVSQYKEEEDGLYNSVKWFQRLRPNAGSDEHKDLQNVLEALKEEQIDLLYELSLIVANDNADDKILIEMESVRKKRLELILSVREKIISNKHNTNTGKIIMKEVDSFLSKHNIDFASIAHQDTGGIDLTSANMNLQIQTDPRLPFGASPVGRRRGNDSEGMKLHIDPAMLEQLQNASGFTPVIINVQLLKDLPAFLGIRDSSPI